MAEHTDMDSHAATYGGMIAMLKWGGLACFVLVMLVIWLIAF